MRIEKNSTFYLITNNSDSIYGKYTNKYTKYIIINENKSNNLEYKITSKALIQRTKPVLISRQLVMRDKTCYYYCDIYNDVPDENYQPFIFSGRINDLQHDNIFYELSDMFNIRLGKGPIHA